MLTSTGFGSEESTNAHCTLRETGQVPLFSYWFRFVVNFGNSLLMTNNALLSKINQADLLPVSSAGTQKKQTVRLGSYLLFTTYLELMCMPLLS